MQITGHDPQYAYGPPMMPMYKGGGDVKETYGLRNAAEQLRERGRGDDTILAHINPQEAGILKLLGGSGTINPYTGLPEFLSFNFVKDIPIVGKPLYQAGSSIGKELERGVESIARNKYLGPIAQMASYLHPVSAFLYAGLAPEGSSFDVKGAAKAAAMQQIGQGIKEYMAGAPQGGYGPDFNPDPYGPGGIDPTNVYSDPTSFASQQAFDAGIDVATAPPVGSVESAVASAGPQAIPYPPDPNSYVSGAPAINQSAVLDSPTMTDGIPAPAPAPTALDMSGFEGGVTERGGSYTPGYNLPPVQDFSRPASPDFSGIRGLDPAGENLLGAAGSVGEGLYDLAVSNPKEAAILGYMGYTAYQTKKELDDARDEANRILADQANKKASDIAWAKGVLRDYDLNYKRLTEEDVRRERGMASGGVASFDDEVGNDDELMQGGIASLAKGGLPPRYLQGAGDGMSDSIHARIGGKQEARLADGEFVVPADVVSHLGNGSSNAGAKKLYAMMDRVRNARTGKKRQAPEVKTERYMPA
jgi:hypothetical protein